MLHIANEYNDTFKILTLSLFENNSIKNILSTISAYNKKRIKLYVINGNIFYSNILIVFPTNRMQYIISYNFVICTVRRSFEIGVRFTPFDELLLAVGYDVSIDSVIRLYLKKILTHVVDLLNSIH